MHINILLDTILANPIEVKSSNDWYLCLIWQTMWYTMISILGAAAKDCRMTWMTNHNKAAAHKSAWLRFFISPRKETREIFLGELTKKHPSLGRRKGASTEWQCRERKCELFISHFARLNIFLKIVFANNESLQYLFGFLSVSRASYNRDTPLFFSLDLGFFRQLSEEYFSPSLLLEREKMQLWGMEDNHIRWHLLAATFSAASTDPVVTTLALSTNTSA